MVATRPLAGFTVPLVSALRGCSGTRRRIHIPIHTAASRQAETRAAVKEVLLAGDSPDRWRRLADGFGELTTEVGD